MQLNQTTKRFIEIQDKQIEISPGLAFLAAGFFLLGAAAAAGAAGADADELAVAGADALATAGAAFLAGFFDADGERFRLAPAAAAALGLLAAFLAAGFFADLAAGFFLVTPFGFCTDFFLAAAPDAVVGCWLAVAALTLKLDKTVFTIAVFEAPMRSFSWVKACLIIVE